MKKLIPFITTLAIMLLSMGVVMAPEPCPFLFEVLTSPPDVTGLTLELTYSDKYGSQSWILQEQVPGEYSIDIGHVGVPNCIYQNFDLVIKECEGSSVCHRTVSFNPQGITVLDVRSANLFITTTTIEVVTTVPECFTSAECAELCDNWVQCDSCCDWCKDIHDKCPDEIREECLTGDYCPEAITLEQLIFAIIVTFAISFTGGVGGYKFVVRETKGEKKEIQITQHKHKGKYEYYHGIHSKHSDVNYRHPVNKEEVLALAKKLNLPEPVDHKPWIYDPKYTIDGKEFPKGG